MLAISPTTIDNIIMYVNAIPKALGTFNLTKNSTRGLSVDIKISAKNKTRIRSLIRYINQRAKIKMAIKIIVL